MKAKNILLLTLMLALAGVVNAGITDSSNRTPSHPLLAGGPMLGHAGLRYASVWVQTYGPAELCLEYRLISDAVDSSREPWVGTFSSKEGRRCLRVSPG
ncbi:MAG: hypothetical protein ACO31H_07275, partial [Bacteroidia bacterium]